MDNTQKNFLVDNIEGKFGDNITYPPSSPLGDYDVTTFSHSPYGHGEGLQTSDGGFTEYVQLSVTEYGGIPQSGQSNTVLAPTFNENLSYEDGRSHEGLFAHSQENIDPWQLGEFKDVPPPPYTSNDPFLTSGLAIPPDSKELLVGPTSIGTGPLPLPYNTSHYEDAKFQPKSEPVPDHMNQKTLYPHPQKRKVLKARPVGSEKITAAAEKRRLIEATLICPFHVDGCKAKFTTRHNISVTNHIEQR